MAAVHSTGRTPCLDLGVRLQPGALTTTGRVGRDDAGRAVRSSRLPAVVENAEINRLGVGA
jgi:hypothetical protein